MTDHPTTIEGLIMEAKARLEKFEREPLCNKYNREAIICLTLALKCLHARTADRIERGVEGSMQP